MKISHVASPHDEIFSQLRCEKGEAQPLLYQQAPWPTATGPSRNVRPGALRPPALLLRVRGTLKGPPDPYVKVEAKPRQGQGRQEGGCAPSALRAEKGEQSSPTTRRPRTRHSLVCGPERARLRSSQALRPVWPEDPAGRSPVQ